ncbi:cbb3-type cytochrome c oxidase subunit I [Roseomonas sp. NAR14]|uniref:Cbb3-type cytochrome c oxidase subunit I n=1 Tax=Roseomonas acroporae TaxID=2937791 RepID=A0A9X1YCA3_9PROT|nr:cbb3-type cytochrome c oxidase subunit I [Roseomonas acroporae]MCK8787506.1 cbb3-type cytochrome c oxidase subunit I [Roseomonas acroporae]
MSSASTDAAGFPRPGAAAPATAAGHAARTGIADTPNPLPRPPGEAEALARAWAFPRGWRVLSEVNNTLIGPLFLGTALLFFLLAGVLGLLIRLQLVVPGNALLDAATYNQVFTMHGTVMMFLFAVPAVEAVGIILMPSMLGTRELPFPRLGAYAYYAYAVGGLVFFGSLFLGAAPDGGWFMYPPLTSREHSPGINTDMYLLGIGFIEISAIAGAIELTVGILCNRAPGMTLGRIPIFAWAMLVFAVMVLVAFPAVIVASLLLELERALGWPFFRPEAGGDPLLWQHLFWFFGHPEVYIIFLPAAGMVSMMVPAMARTPLVGHGLVVVALVGTAFLSFGLWVHHMYATGIPALSLSFFAAAGSAVAIPSGLQIFAWIATLAAGRLRLNEVPSLFVLGFLFIFTLGGLTGVMVAMTPFDWQAHDTYFIVAHLHYVLIGGMVFPLLGGLYYWAPTMGGRLSDRLGRWAFWLLFLGTNLAFFPMHLSGLIGMPRRIYTYPAGMGLELPNLLSTLGALCFGAGAAVVLADFVLHYRPSRAGGSPWGAGTLEWLPGGNWGLRSIPRIASRYPLWDRPALAEEVETGGHYLPGTATGRRESLVTSPTEAEPQYVGIVAGPGWAHVVAALATAAHFLLLTGSLYIPSLAAGVLAVAAMLWWLWHGTDHGPIVGRIAIGGGIVLPDYLSGPRNTSWWAMVVLMLADASVFACLAGTYLFLWLVNAAGLWPPPGLVPPWAGWAALSGLGWLGAAGVLWAARPGPGRRGGPWPHRAALLAALALLAGALCLDLWAQWRAGVRPDAHAYGATVFALLAWQGFHVATAALMLLYTVARSLVGRIDGVRRVTYDNTALFCGYTAAQGVAGAALLHGFPVLL